MQQLRKCGATKLLKFFFWKGTETKKASHFEMKGFWWELKSGRPPRLNSLYRNGRS